MKYLKQLQKKKIFDTAFVEGLTGNIMTGKSLLQSYKKAGFLLEHFSENLNLSPSLDRKSNV